MAKIICKIEHGFVLGHTIVKDAAKEASIETFDQVCFNTYFDYVFPFIYFLHYFCAVNRTY